MVETDVRELILMVIVGEEEVRRVGADLLCPEGGSEGSCSSLLSCHCPSMLFRW